MVADLYSKCDVEFIHNDLVANARKDLLEVDQAQEIAEIFQAMSDPTRVRLISSLLTTELCVCDLAAVLDMTQSAISHQLRLLRDQRTSKRVAMGA